MGSHVLWMGTKWLRQRGTILLWGKARLYPPKPLSLLSRALTPATKGTNMDTNKIIRAIGSAYGNDNPELITDVKAGDIVAKAPSNGRVGVFESEYDYRITEAARYLIHRPIKLPTARGSVILDNGGSTYLRGSIYWVDEVGNEQSEAGMNAVLENGGKILFDAGDVK